jgi:hypothetical protein
MTTTLIQNKKKEASNFNPFNLIAKDLIQNIFSFVGPGHFLFIASVCKDFYACLSESMPTDFLKTHPSSYLFSWKLTKLTINIPEENLRPKVGITIEQILKCDSLYVFQRIIRRLKLKDDWQFRLGIRAIKKNAVEILNWIIHEKEWNYKVHKRDIHLSYSCCNLEMMTYLHENLQINFNEKSLWDVLRSPVTANAETIRYIVSVAKKKDSLTLDSYHPVVTRIISAAIERVYDSDYDEIIKILLDNIFLENDPYYPRTIATRCCCTKREKGIDVMKCIINTEIAISNGRI